MYDKNFLHLQRLYVRLSLQQTKKKTDTIRRNSPYRNYVQMITFLIGIIVGILVVIVLDTIFKFIPNDAEQLMADAWKNQERKQALRRNCKVAGADVILEHLEAELMVQRRHFNVLVNVGSFAAVKEREGVIIGLSSAISLVKQLNGTIE